MTENNWKCTIRIVRKQKEIKDTTISIKDIVLRDYDNLKHDNEIYDTDVTYIPATKDCNQNHVYLSTVINYKTREILRWKLSKTNDIFLVLDSFKNIYQNFGKNVIVHSDHGGAYSSLLFTKILNSKHWKQSMSRIGNSLDNRVIEFWFSILKTELIYNLNIAQITFDELENEIKNFVDYYNNVRIQEKLNWMSPSEYKIQVQ